MIVLLEVLKNFNYFCFC